MGYCSGYSSRESVVRELTRDQENDHQIRRCLKKVMKGLVLWTVWEIEDKSSGEKKRYIGCDAINRWNIGDRKDPCVEWGYKGMDESCGPIYYTCPISFFDDVPDPGGYATEWRAKVREYARQTSKAGLKVGDWIKLNSTTAPFLCVERVKPFRAGGYRVPRRCMAGRMPEMSELQHRFNAFKDALPKLPEAPTYDASDVEGWKAKMKAYAVQREQMREAKVQSFKDWARNNRPTFPRTQWEVMFGPIPWEVIEVWVQMEKENGNEETSSVQGAA